MSREQRRGELNDLGEEGESHRDRDTESEWVRREHVAEASECLARERSAEGVLRGDGPINEELSGSVSEVLICGVRGDTALAAAVNEELRG
jgi:hypothetical protein